MELKAGVDPEILTQARDLIAQEIGQRLWLERTGSSIQSIAEALGFGDATYFSHFFKRMTGYSPLAFRKLARQREDRQSPAFPQTYADWP
jgi:AraC-like DNA-binding protein